MTKRKTQPAEPQPQPEPEPEPEPEIRRTKANIEKALKELQITVPYYTCRLVGNRLEFHLYGGAVKYWPPEKEK